VRERAPARICAHGSRPAHPNSRSLSEYYQWSPENNINSKQHNVNPGDILYGSLTYVPAKNEMVIYHNSSDGWEVTTPIPIQRAANGEYKNYSIGYFVYEK
jgi:Peptidase A4 family